MVQVVKVVMEKIKWCCKNGGDGTNGTMQFGGAHHQIRHVVQLLSQGGLIQCGYGGGNGGGGSYDDPSKSMTELSSGGGGGGGAGFPLLEDSGGAMERNGSEEEQEELASLLSQVVRWW